MGDQHQTEHDRAHVHFDDHGAPISVELRGVVVPANVRGVRALDWTVSAIGLDPDGLHVVGRRVVMLSIPTLSATVLTLAAAYAVLLTEAPAVLEFLRIPSVHWGYPVVVAAVSLVVAVISLPRVARLDVPWERVDGLIVDAGAGRLGLVVRVDRDGRPTDASIVLAVSGADAVHTRAVLDRFAPHVRASEASLVALDERFAHLVEWFEHRAVWIVIAVAVSLVFAKQCWSLAG
ncbi:MAG: hypothetical protein ACHREM_06465 [Polyangiales bacterium]